MRETVTLCRDCIEAAPGVHELCPACGSRRLLRFDPSAALDTAHIDCDAFYASVEKRDDPSLAGKPLIVGHPGGRGVVTTACYVARRYGVRSAMPMFKALQQCPHAVVLPPNIAKYKRVSMMLREIFARATPVIEPLSLDEAYLDLSRAVRSDPRPVPQVLAAIAASVEDEARITVSIGLSCNKFLAKLASDLKKPRGFSIITAGEARAFLAPLPVRKIHGVGEATARRMEALGIATIAELQQLSPHDLRGHFGRFGDRLALYARGEDDRQVTPDRPTKSISAETTFDRNTASLTELKAALEPLCERVARRIERMELAGGSVVLKLKTADFKVLTRSRQLPSATLRADVLLRTACLLLEREADGRAFRLIGIGVADLRPAREADPPDLFEP